MLSQALPTDNLGDSHPDEAVSRPLQPPTSASIEAVVDAPGPSVSQISADDRLPSRNTAPCESLRALLRGFFALSHGPILWSQVSLASDMPDTVWARFNPKSGQIDLNQTQMIRAFEASMVATELDAVDWRKAVFASLAAESFLCDLAMNNRWFSSDGVFAKKNPFSISALVYDAARRDSNLASSLAEKIRLEVSPLQTLGDKISGAVSFVSSLLRRLTHTDQEAPVKISQTSPEFLTLLYSTLIGNVLGLDSRLNTSTFVNADYTRIHNTVECALENSMASSSARPYRGSAVDLLLNAVSLNTELLGRVLDTPVDDVRNLKAFLVESRSDFGRYSDIYRSLLSSLPNANNGANPDLQNLPVAVCGVGLNEEPLTIAIMLAEHLAENGRDPSKARVHVLSLKGPVMQRLRGFQDDLAPYPYPYHHEDVRYGLEKVFTPGRTEEILKKYFDPVYDKLVPKPFLMAMIHYHDYAVGGAAPPPEVLRGACSFLTVHNVLQYLAKGPSYGEIQAEQIEDSFNQLRAVLSAEGSISVRTDGGIHPEVCKCVKFLLYSRGEEETSSST